MNLKARLTALIDQANAFLDAGFALPCKVEALSMQSEGRLVSVWVRFDDGGLSHQVVAATPLTVPSIINAANVAYLLDFLDAQDSEDQSADLIAYATGHEPQAASADGRAVTHPAPGVVQ